MIHLLPLGDLSESIVQNLAPSLQEVFGVPVIPHDPVDLPLSSYDPSRYQHSSTQILKNLAEYKKTLTNVERALGVAAIDLYIPDIDFVIGEADVREGVAIISITRLRPEFYSLPPDEQLFHQRMVKEAAHELGHTYHMGHCPDPACVMHFSSNLQGTDRKGETFCSRCRPRQIPLQSPS